MQENVEITGYQYLLDTLQITHTYLYLIVRKVFYICFANSMTVKINQSTIVYMIINLFRIELKVF